MKRKNQVNMNNSFTYLRSKFIKKKIFLLMAAMLISLISCHSNYVYLNYEMSKYPYPVYKQNDSSKIAFISTQKAYRKAIGILAFPDGGQSKVIYNKTELCIIDKKNGKLTHLMEISSAPYLVTHTKLAFIDDFVYYNCEIDTSKSIDSTRVISIRKKYVKCFSININKKKINQIDTAEFNTLLKKNKFKCNLSVLAKELKKIPLAELGLVIQDIYPKSDKAYIEELIYAKSSGSVSTRAIIEQIISKLDKQEIKAILNKMDEYKNSLDGWDEVYEKGKYEYYLEETSKAIKELL
jgi:hypothetical protein